eukprot:gene7752-2988_t
MGALRPLLHAARAAGARARAAGKGRGRARKTTDSSDDSVAPGAMAEKSS